MMTPEQALQLLDHASSAAQGNRADHKNIESATKVLSDFLTDARIKERFVKPEEKESRD